jgi:cytochrome c biogenesis protein CcmG/thiol:disulfide interchange protein DsbE
MNLNEIKSLKIIGLNYKDNQVNAKKFINQLGNPYSENLVDEDGKIAIELGAYGVPETFLINQEKKIIKKYIGPLNEKSLNEIKSILK